jgi:hypothetical protein
VEKFIEQLIVEARRNLRLRTLLLSESANTMVCSVRFPESKPSTPPEYASYRMHTFYYAVQMSAAEMEDHVRKVVPPLALSDQPVEVGTRFSLAVVPALRLPSVAAELSCVIGIARWWKIEVISVMDIDRRHDSSAMRLLSNAHFA